MVLKLLSVLVIILWLACMFVIISGCPPEEPDLVVMKGLTPPVSGVSICRHHPVQDGVEDQCLVQSGLNTQQEYIKKLRMDLDSLSKEVGELR